MSSLLVLDSIGTKLVMKGGDGGGLLLASDV